MTLWWPHAEALLRQQAEWQTLAPVLQTFTRFIEYERQLLTAED